MYTLQLVLHATYISGIQHILFSINLKKKQVFAFLLLLGILEFNA